MSTSFDKNFYPLSMNSKIELEKFEPGPKFENTLNKIKYNNLKCISSTTMNLSDITLSDNNFK